MNTDHKIPEVCNSYDLTAHGTSIWTRPEVELMGQFDWPNRGE